MSDAGRITSPFLSSVSDFMMVRHYGKRTIKAFLYWIKYFILFHEKRHLETMGAPEIEAFLTHLAINRKVSIATQKIASLYYGNLHPCTETRGAGRTKPAERFE